MSKKGDRCISNIYGHEVVQDAWLLGDLFLKNVYTVFDAEEKRIGFAEKAPLPTKADSTPTNGPASTSGGPDGQATPATSPVAPSPNGPGGEDSTVSVGSGEAATQTTGSTQSNPGDQLESNVYVSIICVVGVIAMVA
jgi:hypothetical protein